MPQTSLTHLKIAFVSQPEYFRFMYEHDLDDCGEVREFKLTYSMRAEQFLELLEYSADINIFFRGEYVPSEVLQQLHGIKINLSSEPFPREINKYIEYTSDSLKRYCSFRIIRNKPFDYVFHYDALSLNFMQNDGLKLSGEFAFPVATGVYKPMAVPKEWDVFFIGRSTNHREQYFGPLKHYYNFLHIAHGIWGAELVKYMNASRIGLNVHAENEISWEPRLQMMLACGLFVISEKITSNLYLRPGIDYIEVSNQYELFDAVSHYLQYPNECDSIAMNGYNRVQELLCSRTAFKNLIEGIYQGKYSRFAPKPGRSFFDIYIKAKKISAKFRGLLLQG
jgi:Glycosyl transferases group 1